MVDLNIEVPCGEGAPLHGLEVEYDPEAEQTVYTTGRCRNCGEKLHEPGEPAYD